jgi:hypothetical protein
MKLKKSISSYVAEFFVIFISITVAFLSENWREQLQEKEDYNLILEEINSNLKLDSIEFDRDISSIERQINAIGRLLDSENPCPVDSLEYYFDQLMYAYRWPDVKSTGIGQLRNSKNIYPDSELITEVNNYYTWTEFLKESTPYQYIMPQNEFNEWLIQNEVLAKAKNSEQWDPGEFRQLKIRLQHLRKTKELQRGIYKVGLSKIVDLIRFFNNWDN